MELVPVLAIDPTTDYDKANCTHGNCDRRGDYLKSATTLLVQDLQEMTAAWAPLARPRRPFLLIPKQASPPF